MGNYAIGWEILSQTMLFLIYSSNVHNLVSVDVFYGLKDFYNRNG